MRAAYGSGRQVRTHKRYLGYNISEADFGVVNCAKHGRGEKVRTSRTLEGSVARCAHRCSAHTFSKHSALEILLLITVQIFFKLIFSSKNCPNASLSYPQLRKYETLLKRMLSGPIVVLLIVRPETHQKIQNIEIP